MNERISFPLKKMSFSTGFNKRFVQRFFPRNGKTVSNETLFEKWEQNGFR